MSSSRSRASLRSNSRWKARAYWAPSAARSSAASSNRQRRSAFNPPRAHCCARRPAMHHQFSRRDALALFALAAFASNANAQTGDHRMTDADLARHAHDWDWLAGSWNVRHRRLNGRLVGSTDWQEFDGTCRMVPTLAGLGNMDDNWLDLPSGAYRAMGIRAFNPDTAQWSIWWLDAPVQTIEPPVRGGV